MLVHNSNLLSLREVFQAIFRRRKLVLLIFLLTVIPVGIATFTAPKIYRATAKVLVRREDRLGALNPYFSRLDQEEDIRSELEIATSRPVLKNLLFTSLAQGQRLADFDSATSSYLENYFANGYAPELKMIRQKREELAAAAESENKVVLEKALKSLGRHIGVEAVTGANVIALGFEDSDPQRAAWFVNALADAYVTYNAEVHGGIEAENFLVERISEARARLDSLEKVIYTYRAATGLVEHNKQQDFMYEKYRSTDQQLSQLREQAEVLTAKVRRLREIRSTADSLAIPTAEMDAHPSVRQLYSRLTELRLQRNALAGKYKSNHRMVMDLNSQINGVQTQLMSEVERLLALENEHLKSLRQEEQVLARMMANVKGDIHALPAKERVLNELQLETDNARKIYSLLVMRREEMSVEKATDRRLSRITVISPAGVPFEPISPRPARNLILSVVLGLLAGLAAGLLREFQDGTFKSPHEVTVALGIPVLGTISADPRKRNGATRPVPPRPSAKAHQSRNDSYEPIYHSNKNGAAGTVSSATTGDNLF